MVVESRLSSLLRKRNLCWRLPQRFFVSESCQRSPEQILEQSGGAALVSIQQGGAAGRLGDPQMDQRKHPAKTVRGRYIA